MADFIWFLGAATDPPNSRGFMPGDFDGPDRNAIFQMVNTLKLREARGDSIDPSEYPTAYQPVRTNPKKKLDVPVWYSNLLHVREDVAKVMEQFDLGQTSLIPLSITMPDETIRNDFRILSVANLRPTIDDEVSERIRQGHPLRPMLVVGKSPHPNMFALPSAVEGPAIWRDPRVMSTLFLNDELAQALLSEDFGKALKLKKIKVHAN